MNRSGALGIDLIRNRAILKSWVLKRIALTPVDSQEEMEASYWFHDLPVDDRSKMITDLARLSIAGVDVREIDAGPLGEFVRRYPELIRTPEPVVEREEPVLEEARELVAAFVGSAGEHAAAEIPWSESWQELESSEADAHWHNN